MISVSSVGLAFSGQVLFENISFVINSKDRIGLVGKNGAGKSSLLNLIAGKQRPSEGTVVPAPDKTIGYLPQEIRLKSDKTVYDEALMAFEQLNTLEDEIKIVEQKLAQQTDYESDAYAKLLNRHHELHASYDYLDGAKRESKVEKILKGLGFKESDFNRNMSEFSGGWQMRVELAKILLLMPDFILLDEPTNHLDIESIIWLEDFLNNYPGGVILVSHDKQFLDHITNRTIEIINGRIYDYKLSYSDFLESRSERLASQIAAAKNQAAYIKQQERFIERFRSKNTKAKQVQSKIRQLEKLDRIELDESDERSIKFKFPEPPRSGDLVIEVKNASKKYDQHQVLQNLNFIVERGERLAFVGKNGEGKTTLVRMLMNEVDYDGLLKIGHNVEIGYYAQVQEKTLDENLTVFETLFNISTGEWASEAKVRGLLGAFLFSADDMDKKVKVLSGGEKSRLAIAKLILHPVNLLILDEPTNHLDISAKAMLKEALQSFSGTIIIVSHDRDFLTGLTQRTFEFTNKHIREHLGDIEEFLIRHRKESFREFEKKTESKRKEKQTDHTSDHKKQHLQRKELERQIRKIRNAIQKTEGKIETVEAEIEELEVKMQDQQLMSDAEQSMKIFEQHKQQQKLLEDLMKQWEQYSSELESFEE